MLTSQDKNRLSARRYAQSRRRSARDDRVEAAALLLRPQEHCIALYRTFAHPVSYPHYRLDEQRRAVSRLASLVPADVITSYSQPETLSAGGRFDERNRLAAAILACQAQRATLVIAMLGHLAASAPVLSQLAASGIKFVACDMPGVNHLTIANLAADRQRTEKARIERLRVTQKNSNRKVTRKHGIEWLGVEANRALARRFAAEIIPQVDAERQRGRSMRQIASHLNAIGIRTRRGRAWTVDSLNRFFRLHANAASIRSRILPAEREVPPAATDGRSGFPGRPSSRAIVLADLRRRHAAGERHPSRFGGESAQAWASVLSASLAADHPEAPQAAAITVRLVIGPLLRELAAGST